MSPGYSAPWAGPGVPLKAIKWMLMQHSPLVIWPMLDPAMWRWGAMMLANCTARAYALNKSRMVPIAEYSRDCMKQLRAETGISYDDRAQGTLQLFRTQKQLDGIGGDVAVLRQYGVPFEVLDRAGFCAVEPALQLTQEKFVGALRLPGDETGDCFKFSQRLAELAAGLGVRFRWNTRIESLQAGGGAITGVFTDAGLLQADRVVLALGSYSPLLLKPVGLCIPVYPVKGYSITVPITDPSGAPESTITVIPDAAATAGAGAGSGTETGAGAGAGRGASVGVGVGAGSGAATWILASCRNSMARGDGPGGWRDPAKATMPYCGPLLFGLRVVTSDLPVQTLRDQDLRAQLLDRVVTLGTAAVGLLPYGLEVLGRLGDGRRGRNRIVAQLCLRDLTSRAAKALERALADQVAAVEHQPTNGPTNQTVSGASLLANSGATDVALLQLNSTPPSSYNVYYSGWDRSGVTPTAQTCIHHPAGDIKKISFDTNAPGQATYAGASCWRIFNWEDGTTKPGSSGSGLWDQNKRLIGQLYGGDASCSNNVNDYYGRLDLSFPLLQTWLGNCGNTLNGYDPNAPTVSLDAQAISITGASGNLCSSSVSPTVTVRNGGTSTLTSFTVNWSIPGGPSGSTPWTGSLTSGNTTTVSLGSITLPAGILTLSATVASPNGGTDLVPGNNTATSNFVHGPNRSPST